MRLILKLTSRYAPGLEHWSNLGAFSSMVALSSGIMLASALPSRLIFQEKLYPVYLSCAIAALACGILFRQKKFKFTAFLFGGGLMYLLQSIACHNEESTLVMLAGSLQRIEGEVISPPAPRADKVAFLLKVRKVVGDRRGILSGKVFDCTGPSTPTCSGLLTLEGRLSTAQHRRNRYGFDEAEFFRAGGIAGKIVVEKIVSEKPPEQLLARIASQFRTWLLGVLKLYHNPDHRALIRASFTGEKAYIAPEINLLFQRSGLYHLLALSGFNAAILLAALYVLLAPFPLNIVAKHIVALMLLWLYNGFVGPIPSLMRAVIMATVVIGALMFQRKNYPLQTFGIAGSIWLLLSPSSLFQPGFQLSYGATFGILTLHALFSKMYRGLSHPVADAALRPLYGSLSVSLAACIATLPILLYHFGTFSLYGLVANIVAIPLMSFSMWAFFCALLFAPFSILLSGAAVAVSGWVMEILLAVAAWADKVPFCMMSGYAPYPELIVAFYLLVIAVVTVERRNVVKVLFWGIPLLMCVIPADYLVRRVTAAPSIIRFATPEGCAISAVRRPCGATRVFCTGKAAAIRRFLGRDVAVWRHHVPGTVISRIVTVEGENLVDSSITGRKRVYHEVGGLSWTDSGSHRPSAYNCMFSRKRMNGWALEVTCAADTMISDHSRQRGYIRNSGSSLTDTVTVPFEAVLRGSGFVVQ